MESKDIVTAIVEATHKELAYVKERNAENIKDHPDRKDDYGFMFFGKLLGFREMVHGIRNELQGKINFEDWQRLNDLWDELSTIIEEAARA